MEKWFRNSHCVGRLSVLHDGTTSVAAMLPCGSQIHAECTNQHTGYPSDSPADDVAYTLVTLVWQGNSATLNVARVLPRHCVRYSTAHTLITLTVAAAQTLARQ